MEGRGRGEAGEGKENKGKHLLCRRYAQNVPVSKSKEQEPLRATQKKKNNTVSSTTNHGQQGVKGLGVKRRGNANEM